MKPINLFLAFLLLASTAHSQNAIVIMNRNGKTKTSIPVSVDGQSPSVILTQPSGGGMFFASGQAAQILARNQAPPVERSSESAPPETIIHPIYDEQGLYVGSASKLADKVYVAAAHVMTEIHDLANVAYSLHVSVKELQIFQPEMMGRALDVVFITTLSESDLQKTLMNVFQNSETADDSHHSYAVNYLSTLDRKIVKFESQGVWSSALDQKTIYLKSMSSNLLTWGSSGSLVFSQNDHQQFRLIGVVQCAVKIEVATSQEQKNVDYFRAISVKSILSSVIKPVDLQVLRQRAVDYDLNHCDPVSGKKGGGG